MRGDAQGAQPHLHGPAEQRADPAELPVHLGRLQGHLGDQQGRLHQALPQAQAHRRRLRVRHCQVRLVIPSFIDLTVLGGVSCEPDKSEEFTVL